MRYFMTFCVKETPMNFLNNTNSFTFFPMGFCNEGYGDWAIFTNKRATASGEANFVISCLLK